MVPWSFAGKEQGEDGEARRGCTSVVHDLAQVASQYTGAAQGDQGRRLQKLRSSILCTPACISEAGRTLVARLYAHDSHALWRMDPTTRTVEPTPWKLDLDEFCQHATFSDRGPRWRHYCYVTPGSQAHKDGKRVGARCCSSRAESADRTASVICSVVTGRTWKLACESRFPLGSKQQGSQRPILQFQIWNLHMRVPSIYVCSHLRVSESTLLSATSQLNLQVGQPAGEPARFGRRGRAGRPARPARPDRPARGHILGNP